MRGSYNQPTNQHTKGVDKVSERGNSTQKRAMQGLHDVVLQRDDVKQQVSKQTSKQADKQASRQAGKQTSKQACCVSHGPSKRSGLWSRV